MGTLETEIRLQLARLLVGDISLSDFEDWFVPATWDVDRTGTPAARELAGHVHLRLAEFSSGDWTEAELRDLLRPLVERYQVTLYATPGYGAPGPHTVVTEVGSGSPTRVVREVVVSI